MRTIAVFAVIVGGLELFNVLNAAGAVGRGGQSTMGVAIVVVTTVVMSLLLVSGVALLVRGRRAIVFGQVAALASLLLFAVLAAIRPGFSIASMFLGVAFPIAMLVGLLRQARGESRRAGG